MTLRTTALTLFASTIATGLGFALAASAFIASVNDESYAAALFAGAALLLLGPAFFVGIASRAARRDEKTVKVALGAFVTGMLSVWFWLVPAQTAFLTGACRYGNFGACDAVVEQGGFPADVALGNDDFVVRQCEVLGKGNYCRLAAARRLSSPTKFCRLLSAGDAFEVVEWCTADRTGWRLVARR